MIDLCKIFGVEEGEEFKIEYIDGSNDTRVFKIKDGYMCDKSNEKDEYATSTMPIYMVTEIKNITKLPKKKEFTDDELAIMRSLPKKYKWMVRDRYDLCLYKNKPEKIDEDEVWDDISGCILLEIFDHLFQNIQCEDEEPVFIDDYVER